MYKGRIKECHTHEHFALLLINNVTHSRIQKYYVKKRLGAIVFCVIRVIDTYTKQINKHLQCRIRFLAIAEKLKKINASELCVQSF